LESNAWLVLRFSGAPVGLTILKKVQPCNLRLQMCREPLPYDLNREGRVNQRTTQIETNTNKYKQMLAVALEEAQQGFAEGGIPIGAALFTRAGELVSRGHNRRVQQGDPSVHGETDAFRRAGRQKSYRDLVMVTTLAPCWYCSGLVRQFRIPTLVVGESRTFAGGLDWLRENGVEVIDLDSRECRQLLERFISQHPEIWNEDIGED